jgi:hypothetical protein
MVEKIGGEEPIEILVVGLISLCVLFGAIISYHLAYRSKDHPSNEE